MNTPQQPPSKDNKTAQAQNPFSGRKKARRFAMQALYGWSLTQNPIAEIEAFILSEHPDTDFDQIYFSELIQGVIHQVQTLDTVIEPFLSRALEELDFVELAVLRIAAYELKVRLEIPYRVIINEALNLTKNFGATDSYKFVNGVLDKMAKELRVNEMYRE